MVSNHGAAPRKACSSHQLPIPNPHTTIEVLPSSIQGAQGLASTGLGREDGRYATSSAHPVLLLANWQWVGTGSHTEIGISQIMD